MTPHELLTAVASFVGRTGLTLWLVDAALKSILMLLLTAGGAWLMRKRSAAAVHTLWTLGFCACLAVPFVSLLAPEWRLPYLPDSPFGRQIDRVALRCLPITPLPWHRRFSRSRRGQAAAR